MPNTAANTETIIQSAMNGDAMPPVLSTKVAEVSARMANAASEPQKMYFFGAHRYDTNPAASDTAAMIAAASLTSSASPMLLTSAKYAQKYSTKITTATSMIASQIRRCQKRVSVSGLIVCPLFR